MTNIKFDEPSIGQLSVENKVALACSAHERVIGVIGGPKGLRADISSLKRFCINRYVAS